MKLDKFEIARLLDMTLDMDGRGPRTYRSRQNLAAFLDANKPYLGLKDDVKWLRYVIVLEINNSLAKQTLNLNRKGGGNEN